MTEQQIDRDRLRASAESALACGTFDAEAISAVPQLLDQLDQAEARIRHLEATARVLVREVIAAEDARDEYRRGKAAAEAQIAEEKHLRMKATAAAAEAEARIKAVQHLIDQADKMGEWAITCTLLQWAIDGSNPQPGA